MARPDNNDLIDIKKLLKIDLIINLNKGFTKKLYIKLNILKDFNYYI